MGMFTFSTPFQYNTWSTSWSSKTREGNYGDTEQKKNSRIISIWRRYDMMLYMKDTQNSPRRFIEMKNTFSEVARYKNLLAFFIPITHKPRKRSWKHICNEQFWRNAGNSTAGIGVWASWVLSLLMYSSTELNFESFQHLLPLVKIIFYNNEW